MKICSQQTEITGNRDPSLFGSVIEFSIAGNVVSTLIDSDGSYILAPVSLQENQLVKYRLKTNNVYSAWSQEYKVVSCYNELVFNKSIKPTITTSLNTLSTQLTVTLSASSVGFIYLYNGNQLVKYQAINGTSVTITLPKPFDENDIVSCTLVQVDKIESDRSVSKKVIRNNSNNVDYPIFNETKMASLFTVDDVDYLAWAESVKNKLVEQGIIPNYINKIDDKGVVNEDYNAFWLAVTKFFAYYAQFATELKDFSEIKHLLIEYLKQKNLFINEHDSLNDLKKGKLSIFKTVNKRGTNFIFDKAEGEFIKSISYQIFDHFFYVAFKEYEWGWCIGRSSPLYRGITSDRFNLFYSEKTNKKTFFQYNTKSFPFVEPVTLTQLTNDISLVTLGTNGSLGNPSGVNSKIAVSEHQSYIYSCFVKAPINSVFEIGCKAYQLDGTEVNFGISGENLYKSYENYSVKNSTVIYRLDTFLKSYSRSDTKITTNSLLIKPNTAYFAPYIKSTSGNVEIYNVELKPIKTHVSTGFIQTKDVIGIWFKNKSNTKTNLLINKLKSYLFSYKNTIYYEENGINSSLLDTLSDKHKEIVLNKKPIFAVWENSAIIRIINGKKYKEIYDINDPTKTKLVLIETNVKEFNCKENSVYQTIIEKSNCVTPFIYNNKSYHTRFKQLVTDKNCNVLPTSLYFYNPENLCDACDTRNKNPIWESVGKIIKKLCDTTEVITVPLNEELENTHMFEIGLRSSYSPKIVKQKEVVTITYNIANTGVNAITGVFFKAVIPNELEVIDSFDFTLNNNTVTALYNIGIGETKTLVIRAVVVYGLNRKVELLSSLYFSDGVTPDDDIKYKNALTITIS